MRRVGLVAGVVLVLVGCSDPSTSAETRIVDVIGGLECPTDMWESTEAMLDAETPGSASFEDALDEFFAGLAVALLTSYS